ncbi:hypothetical protein BHM03_00003700 [Ensete ventricosum]|nr:hypothetical protein BHM03_00003700 [Ensete ventricosum]
MLRQVRPPHAPHGRVGRRRLRPGRSSHRRQRMARPPPHQAQIPPQEHHHLQVQPLPPSAVVQAFHNPNVRVGVFYDGGDDYIDVWSPVDSRMSRTQPDSTRTSCAGPDGLTGSVDRASHSDKRTQAQRLTFFKSKWQWDPPRDSRA